MSHTYSSLFFHIVWSTKNRMPIIEPPFEKRLYDYIGGIIKKERGLLLSIGGVSDHVHILIQIPVQVSIPDLMRLIKTNSSKFINQTILQNKFLWQEGYGVFSVSLSKLNVVKNYILLQKKHHEKYSFVDEFSKLLNKHNVVYDKKYLFK